MTGQRLYRVRLTCPGGTVNLAPTTLKAAYAEAHARVALALRAPGDARGASTATAVDVLAYEPAGWELRSRRWAAAGVNSP